MKIRIGIGNKKNEVENKKNMDGTRNGIENKRKESRVENEIEKKNSENKARNRRIQMKRTKGEGYNDGLNILI